MLVVIIESMKPVTPSTITCQRPGTSSRFIPPSMKSQISARTMSIHSALLVKTNGLPSRVPASGLIWNWCIGSILLSAATLSTSLSPSFGPLPAKSSKLPTWRRRTRGTASTTQIPWVPGEAVDHPADQRAAERVADHAPRGYASPGADRYADAAPLPARRSAPLSSACALLEPLIERGQPRILGRLRVLPGFVFRHVVLPCAAALAKARCTRARGHAGERTRQGAVPLGRRGPSQHVHAAPHHDTKGGAERLGAIIGRRC